MTDSISANIRLLAAVSLDGEAFLWYFRATYNEKITHKAWAEAGCVLYEKYPNIGVPDASGTCDRDQILLLRNALFHVGYTLEDLMR